MDLCDHFGLTSLAFLFEPLKSRYVALDQPDMEADQVDDESEHQCPNCHTCDIHPHNLRLCQHGGVVEGLAFSLFRFLGENQCQNAEDDREYQCHEHPQKHPHELNVVHPSNVIVDPATVMIEFKAASVTERTVLRVLHHVRLAQVAVELCNPRNPVVVLVSQSLVHVSDQGDGRVSRVTLRDDCSRHDHSEET